MADTGYDKVVIGLLMKGHDLSNTIDCTGTERVQLYKLGSGLSRCGATILGSNSSIRWIAPDQALCL